tara:strand:- start:1190 stop:2011 length:822 start_codon:yes stop_codon:yes gene_type:complete
MSKTILYAGCSFTAMHDSWARQMVDMFPEHKSQVIAKHGAGNDFIARSIVYEVERQKELGTPVTHVFVMWSGPTRHEIMLDTNIFNKLKPWSTEISTYKRVGEWGEQLEENELDFAWAKSGGSYGTFNYEASEIDIENKMLDNYFENYYKVNSNEYFNFRSLEDFHYVQMYCKVNQITLINLTFRDIIGPMHKVIDPSFSAGDKSSVHKYAYLYALIDWRQWYFYDHHGGLREWNLENTNTWDDGYDNHPDKQAHKEYIEKFIKPHILNKGIL